jgi:prolyl-tRNA synthetase
MGALIMSHSDDNGLVLPPELAPIQTVIVPIFKNNEREKFDEKLIPLKQRLEAAGITVKYDNSDTKRPGFKFADYELRGIPVRLVMGNNDYENGTIEIMRRDTLEKETVPFEGIEERIKALLAEMQKNIYEKARKARDSRIYMCDNYDEFKERIKDGGFFLCPWDGTEETEARLKEETQATIRCIPYGYSQDNLGNDMVSGKPAVKRALVARAY